MKKKTMAFGGLLAAVAMTGYSVAGTYAKYISAFDLADEARVAKWDFNVTGKDNVITNKLDLFSDSYYLNDNNLYVKSLNGEKVIAPGTKGEYTFKLVGTSEVRYMLNFDIEAENDVVLYYLVKDGKLAISTFEFTDKTTGEKSKEYRPLTYTITYKRGGEVVNTMEGKLPEIKELLDAYNESDKVKAGFQPGVLDQEYTISWKWDTINEVENLTEDQVNALDTEAGKNLSNNGDTINFDLKVSATQVAEDYSKVKAN